MTTKSDDLDAVRTIASTLEPFDQKERERILRWVRERLGLPTPSSLDVLRQPSSSVPPAAIAAAGVAKDIKTFVAEKNPSSNNEFAATVAYYYRFEAPQGMRKDTISADDLQEACRLAGRSRLPKPAQTLVNAHTTGLLDKSGDRGTYAISTVGENLVAMALPSGKTASTTHAARAKSSNMAKRKGNRKHR